MVQVNVDPEGETLSRAEKARTNGGVARFIESGQIITTSADVTLNGGLIRELPQNPLNSGLGIWNLKHPRLKMVVSIG